MDRTYEEINSLYQDLQDISRLAVANEQRANRVEIWNAEYQRIKASKPEVLKSIKISDLNICLSGANLSGIDLSEANLSGVNLSNADLSFTSLNMVDLSGAVLNYANITGADLRNAKISGADLSWASLNGADLSGAVLNYANMTGADFRNAKISGARFQDAIMVHCHMNQKTSNDASCKEAFEGTNFFAAELTGTNFTGLNLTRTSFIKASLENARFNSAKFQETDFTEARLKKAVFIGAEDICFSNSAEIDKTSVIFDNAILLESQFQHAKFKNPRFDKANMKKTDFTESEFENASFFGTNLNESMFNHVIFKNTSLSHSTMKNVKMTGASLAYCNLSYTDLSNSNLLASDFQNSDFTSANLENTKLWGSCFCWANFQRAYLNHAEFDGTVFDKYHFGNTDKRAANLTGANFKGAMMDNANLSHVMLQYAKFNSASLVNSNLREVKAEYSSFGNANLTNCKLNYAQLEKTDFRYSIIKQADFNNAFLAGATFYMASADGATSFNGVLEKNYSIDENTDFSGVNIPTVSAPPRFKSILEKNIRKHQWTMWYNQKKLFHGFLEIRKHWFAGNNRVQSKCRGQITEEQNSFEPSWIDQKYFTLWVSERFNYIPKWMTNSWVLTNIKEWTKRKTEKWMNAPFLRNSENNKDSNWSIEDFNNWADMIQSAWLKICPYDERTSGISRDWILDIRKEFFFPTVKIEKKLENTPYCWAERWAERWNEEWMRKDHNVNPHETEKPNNINKQTKNKDKSHKINIVVNMTIQIALIKISNIFDIIMNIFVRFFWKLTDYGSKTIRLVIYFVIMNIFFSTLYLIFWPELVDSWTISNMVIPGIIEILQPKIPGISEKLIEFENITRFYVLSSQQNFDVNNIQHTGCILITTIHKFFQYVFLAAFGTRIGVLFRILSP